MKKKFWYLLAGMIIAIVILCFVLPSREPLVEGSKECVADLDCVVFGEDGDCNCGCYNKDVLPSGNGGACFCAAPKSCECVDGICEGIFN